MLDEKTFSDLRITTYALFVEDLQLYYHFAKATLLDFNEQARDLNTEHIEQTVDELNQQLAQIRRVHTERTQILTEDVRARGQMHGIDVDNKISVFASGAVTCRCHSEVRRTVLLPIHVDLIQRSQISSTREVANLTPDLLTTETGTVSEFVSSGVVAELLGGSVSDTQTLARGDRTSLKAYIEDYDEREPCVLRVRVTNILGESPEFVELSFVLRASGNQMGAYLENILPAVQAWASVRDRVSLPSRAVGTLGPLFEYALTTRVTDLDLCLKPGMALSSQEDAYITKVVGERVELAAPATLFGENLFVYKSASTWDKYLPLLSDIVLSGDTQEARIASLQKQVADRVKACTALFNAIPPSSSGIRFDIKNAHHAIGADNAYNLLERGRLIEYHHLTEEQSKRSSIMAMAAAHIRAGTRL